MSAPDPHLPSPSLFARLPALTLLLWGSPAFAFSGFLREPAAGYVKLSFDHLDSSELYSTSGDLLPTSGTFSQSNLSLYGEVGVLEFLTVGVSGAALRLNRFDTSETATGLGDLSLFAKLGGEWKSFHGALIVAVDFPTGRSEAFVETDFEGIRTNLPTGDGETNVWIRAALSRSLPTPSWLPTYVSIHGGVNLRSRFAHQVGFGGEFGVSPGGWFWLQARIDAQLTPADVEDLDPEGIFLFGEGTEYVAVGVGLSVPIPGTPISITGDFRNTFANLKNIYAGSTFGGGLAIEWD